MILGLTGSEEQCKDVAKKYRVYFSEAALTAHSQEDYLIDHTIYFYLMDPTGAFVDVYGRESTSTETYLQIYKHVKKYIREKGRDSVKRVGGKDDCRNRPVRVNDEKEEKALL